MGKQLVFIDESGDPGFKAESSEFFIVAAVLFDSPETAESLMHEIINYRRELGWRDNHEFKFTKNPKNVIVNLLRRATNYNFQVYAIYVQKKELFKINPAMRQILEDQLYNWLMKELLLQIPLGIAKITIDGRSNKQYRKATATYLRKELSGKGSKKLDFRFEDSVRTDLIQFADIVAGSVNRSLQPNKTDSKDYINLLQDRIVIKKKIEF